MKTQPERNAEIVRRREAGEWPTEIAKALGISRNAVIGVLNRCGKCTADVDRSAIMKRFGVRGEASGAAKLTEAEVRAIRREYQPYDAELGRNALARRYGVGVSTIHRITMGDGWKHVA